MLRTKFWDRNVVPESTKYVDPGMRLTRHIQDVPFRQFTYARNRFYIIYIFYRQKTKIALDEVNIGNKTRKCYLSFVNNKEVE